jgi:TRAP-type C4-dicarboxylate transport system permease small subunit
MDRALALWWRALTLLGQAERVAGVFLIALMVITITIQVVTRYAFGQPLVWVEELATYSFIWSVFLGAALGFKEMRHIRIETFLDRIKPRSGALFRAALYALVLVCSVALASHALDIMEVERRSETMSLPINVGRHWFYSVPLFTGLASMALTSAYFIAAYLALAMDGRVVDAERDIVERRRIEHEAEEEELRTLEQSI